MKYNQAEGKKELSLDTKLSRQKKSEANLNRKEAVGYAEWAQRKQLLPIPEVAIGKNMAPLLYSEKSDASSRFIFIFLSVQNSLKLKVYFRTKDK
jgi:hypothetical protein